MPSEKQRTGERDATILDTQQIVFDALSCDQWRILDGRLDEGDVAALLGFVENVAGVYEVLLLADPATPRFCARLEDVRSEIGPEGTSGSNDDVTTAQKVSES